MSNQNTDFKNLTDTERKAWILTRQSLLHEINDAQQNHVSKAGLLYDKLTDLRVQTAKEIRQLKEIYKGG